MKRLLLVLAVAMLALLTGGAMAHEHWVDVDAFYPAPGETVRVYVSSGHYFPESSNLLKDDVIDYLGVWRAGEGPIPLESLAEEKMRTAALPADSEGVYLVCLTLKRPKAKEPNYEAKVLVVANPAADDPKHYATGKGLELIPLRPVSQAAPGGKIPVVLAMDGKRIAGSLEVIPEWGKGAVISTDESTPGMIPIGKAGKYLVTSYAEGRGCSLVFEVREMPKDTEGSPHKQVGGQR